MFALEIKRLRERMPENNFGKWLFEKRKDKHPKMSQEDLAQQAGCSRAYISLLERGEGHPKTGKPIRPEPEMIQRLANALGANYDDALRAAGYLPDSDQGIEVELRERVEDGQEYEENDEPTIVAYYDGLPPDDQDVLLATAKALWEKKRKSERVIGRRQEDAE